MKISGSLYRWEVVVNLATEWAAFTAITNTNLLRQVDTLACHQGVWRGEE